AQAQVGERILRRNPYYEMMDMLVAPITCQHLREVAEIWEYDGDIEMFKLGIPHNYGGDFELEYYVDRLRALAERLQAFTGNEITDGKIGDAIELYNRMRGSLRELSLMRSTSPLPISTLDFVKLNHASYYADPGFMVEVLESICRKMKGKQVVGEMESPRVLLVGPNIANGDYRILELVKEAGAEVVIEEVCEGVRYYWNLVDNKGDPFKALAKGYLEDRLPCAFMRHSARKRLDFALKLIRDFNVSGVLWYELRQCETYDSESYFFERELNKRNIPMLILEADYGMADVGQIKTRLEAFIEMVKGGIEY
ncbi:MAG: 2-hydroxyacyl-CoA dehydratase subunit D, partial [Dehalococcoidia bacterium]